MLGTPHPPTQGWTPLTLELGAGRGDLGEVEGGGAQDLAAVGPRGGQGKGYGGVSPQKRGGPPKTGVFLPPNPGCSPQKTGYSPQNRVFPPKLGCSPPQNQGGPL